MAREESQVARPSCEESIFVIREILGRKQNCVALSHLPPFVCKPSRNIHMRKKTAVGIDDLFLSLFQTRPLVALHHGCWRGRTKRFANRACLPELPTTFRMFPQQVWNDNFWKQTQSSTSRLENSPRGRPILCARHPSQSSFSQDPQHHGAFTKITRVHSIVV